MPFCLSEAVKSGMLWTEKKRFCEAKGDSYETDRTVQARCCLPVHRRHPDGRHLRLCPEPKVFAQMGKVGNVIGCLFFAMVLFAAFTSAVSVMEAIVASIMDEFHTSRAKAGIIELIVAIIVGTIVCLGYNKLYFEVKLPNGSIAQILDIMDYISNNIMMPIVAIGTCILVGWISKPQTVIEEVQKNGEKFSRKGMYVVMVKFITPILLFILFLKSIGLLTFI